MYTYVFSYNSYMYNLCEYMYNVYIYVHIFENVREYISVHLYIKFT